MGYRLYREVLDHAPADLTPAELVVLLVLADAALDETRRTSRGMAELTRWTRLKADTIGKVFRRLAARGLEVRVPVGTNAAGRPVFAHRGHQNDYLIPDLGLWRDEERAASRPGIPDRMAGRASGLSGGNGLPLVRESPDDRQTQGTARTAQQSRTRRMTGQERAAVLAEIHRRRPGIGERLALHVLREDGWDILAELDAAAQRAQLADQLAEIRRGPECEHRTPGGASLHPVSGQPLCPLCRADQTRRTSA